MSLSLLVKWLSEFHFFETLWMLDHEKLAGSLIVELDISPRSKQLRMTIYDQIMDHFRKLQEDMKLISTKKEVFRVFQMQLSNHIEQLSQNMVEGKSAESADDNLHDSEQTLPSESAGEGVYGNYNYSKELAYTIDFVESIANYMKKLVIGSQRDVDAMRNTLVITLMLVLILLLGVFIINFLEVRQLQRIESKLLQTNQEKDMLFSVLSHDLKNAFGSLLSLTTLLDHNFDSIEKQKRKKFLTMMNVTTYKVYHLFETLLEWTHSQLHQPKCSPEYVPIKSAVESILAPYEALVDEKKIQVKLEIPEDQKLWIDSTMFAVIIRNLFQNALKFTQENGTIHISTHEENNYIQIIHSDSGIGMSAAQLHDIFKINPYLDKKRTDRTWDTGLGLLLCKTYTEKNAGTIEVTSSLGEGTTFLLIFPNK